jgi:hypothetical protein
MFAEGELLLELIYLVQNYFSLDLESIVIMLCVNDATMRPYMAGRSVEPAILTQERVPEELRGGISRLMIADKTGLPRETVRRRCKELVARGHLEIDGESRLRARPDLANPALLAVVENAHQAIHRYLARTRSL